MLGGDQGRAGPILRSVGWLDAMLPARSSHGRHCSPSANLEPQDKGANAAPRTKATFVNPRTISYEAIRHRGHTKLASTVRCLCGPSERSRPTTDIRVEATPWYVPYFSPLGAQRRAWRSHFCRGQGRCDGSPIKQKGAPWHPGGWGGPAEHAVRGWRGPHQKIWVALSPHGWALLLRCTDSDRQEAGAWPP